MGAGPAQRITGRDWTTVSPDGRGRGGRRGGLVWLWPSPARDGGRRGRQRRLGLSAVSSDLRGHLLTATEVSIAAAKVSATAADALAAVTEVVAAAAAVAAVAEVLVVAASNRQWRPRS